MRGRTSAITSSRLPTDNGLTASSRERRRRSRTLQLLCGISGLATAGQGAWPMRPSCWLDVHAPRSRFASCRTSSLSILYFSVLSGIPRYSAVPVTFQPHFSSARRMKLRSKVLVASSNRLSLSRPLRLELGEVEFERQVLFGDVVLVADRHQPLDQVLELADVARPPVLLQHRHRRVGDALDLLPEPRVVALQEELGELRDVLGALAQRRQLDRDDVDPVVEVLAEAPFLDRLLEVDVGRGDQPELGLDRLACRRRARSRLPGSRAAAWPAGRAADRRFRRGTACRSTPARTCRAAAGARR